MTEYDKDQELRDKCDEPDFHDQVLVTRDDVIKQLGKFLNHKNLYVETISDCEVLADGIVDWFVDEQLISQRFSK